MSQSDQIVRPVISNKSLVADIRCTCVGYILNLARLGGSGGQQGGDDQDGG